MKESCYDIVKELCYDIVIKIGVVDEDEDKALSQYDHILSFIEENLPYGNYTIEIVEVGEYM